MATTLEMLQALAGKRQWLAHQSTGNYVFHGPNDDNAVGLTRTFIDNPTGGVVNARSHLAGGIPVGTWGDDYNGTNGYPTGKIDAFDTTVRNGLYALDFFGFKFCWVDFVFNSGEATTTTAKVDTLWAHYQSVMDALESSYPGKIIFWTVPVMNENGGDPENNNTLRERMSDYIRGAYGSTGRVFDIADWESRDSGGTLVLVSGRRSLNAAWDIGDHGHPNAAGSTMLAGKYLEQMYGLVAATDTAVSSSVTLSAGVHALRITAASALTLRPIDATLAATDRSGTAATLSGTATLGAPTALRADGGTLADLTGTAALSTATGTASLGSTDHSGTAADLTGSASLGAPTSTRAVSGTLATLAGTGALGTATGNSSLNPSHTGTVADLSGAATLGAATATRAVSATAEALAGSAALSTATGSGQHPNERSGTALDLGAAAALGTIAGAKDASGTCADCTGALALSDFQGYAGHTGTCADLVGLAELSTADGAQRIAAAPVMLRVTLRSPVLAVDLEPPELAVRLVAPTLTLRRS